MMNLKNNVARLAMIPLLSAVLPTVAQAATPRAMLEKSATYALDNQVRAFRVPVQGSTEPIKFYDVTIQLEVLPNGTLDPLADVIATLSPTVTTGVIAPGTYKSLDNATTCTVTNITLSNARIQSFLNCTYNGASPPRLSNVSVATGSISAGHPFQAPLVAAGLHTRPDANTFTWGLVTNGLL
jgi:hypothetical protein